MSSKRNKCTELYKYIEPEKSKNPQNENELYGGQCEKEAYTDYDNWTENEYSDKSDDSIVEINVTTQNKFKPWTKERHRK